MLMSGRPTRPLPLIPQRPAPVPMRSPLMGPRSPDSNRQFDEMMQQFSSGDGSRSPSISPSMVSSRPSPVFPSLEIFQDMFADAPDDDTSASSYDLTKPLRTNSSKRPVNRRADKSVEILPVLPFRSKTASAMGAVTTPLIIQKEPSRLRISSLITPRPANPLLAVPTLDKRTVSAPVPQPVPLMSPVLVNRNSGQFRPPPIRRRSTFKPEFFRQGSLKESSNYGPPQTKVPAEAHPLQQRLNTWREPVPIKRKWSSRLRPGGESSSRTVMLMVRRECTSYAGCGDETTTTVEEGNLVSSFEETYFTVFTGTSC
jgi:hypothetical protein